MVIGTGTEVPGSEPIRWHLKNKRFAQVSTGDLTGQRAGRVLNALAYNGRVKILVRVLLVLAALPLGAQTASTPSAAAIQNERLGAVSFPVSCAATSQTPFNRGVAPAA
jgi:hypothetical protein